MITQPKIVGLIAVALVLASMLAITAEAKAQHVSGVAISSGASTSFELTQVGGCHTGQNVAIDYDYSTEIPSGYAALVVLQGFKVKFLNGDHFLEDIAAYVKVNTIHWNRVDWSIQGSFRDVDGWDDPYEICFDALVIAYDAGWHPLPALNRLASASGGDGSTPPSQQLVLDLPAAHLTLLQGFQLSAKIDEDNQLGQMYLHLQDDTVTARLKDHRPDTFFSSTIHFAQTNDIANFAPIPEARVTNACVEAGSNEGLYKRTCTASVNEKYAFLVPTFAGGWWKWAEDDDHNVRDLGLLIKNMRWSHAQHETRVTYDVYTTLRDNNLDDGGNVVPFLQFVGLGAPNNPPIAGNDIYRVGANQTLTIAASDGVLANDSDPDGDLLTAHLESNPANGTLNFMNDGSFEYTPDADYSGPDTFTYSAQDGEVSSSATVTLNVGDDTIWIAPQETVETTGNPLYQWYEVPGSMEYAIYVGPEDGYVPAVYYGTVPASVCSNGVCAVDLTTQTSLIAGADGMIFVGGSYVAFLNPYPNDNSAWIGPFEFVATGPQPNVPSSLNVERSSFTWTLSGTAGYANYFHIYLAPTEDINNPLTGFPIWVSRRQACGGWNGSACSYPLPTSMLQNGVEYTLYIQSWGLSGYSTGGLGGNADGWIGYTFTAK